MNASTLPQSPVAKPMPALIVVDTARVQSDYGYSLFVASQPISRCTNDDQRRGWKEAERGYHASLLVEAVFAFGGNAIDADYALAGNRN